MPKLQIVRPDGSQTDHELTGETVTIGRAPDCVLQLDEVGISSHHAQISPAQDGYLLKDLQSTNGTKVNGQTLEAQTEYALKPGDRIIFGKLDAIFDPEHAEAGAHKLPAGEERVLAAASQSIKPSNFMNASPFQKRAAKRDPMDTAALIFGAAAILMTLVVLLMAMNMARG
jgi:pSer/pThr/pTyr-binding forkhead associated (FHA) protein